MKLLESGFGSPKNKDKRRSYRKSHYKEEMIKICKKKMAVCNARPKN